MASVTPASVLDDPALAGFRGAIRPVPATWLYRVALVLVAVLMLLLPLLYLAVIAALGWTMYWHATANAGTCAVNASASLRRGLLSLFANDLVLTIGLPLVACQSLPQFTGVLAHEFGHLSQSVGMRAVYVIRRVNHWFARVVYERDQWDVRVERWTLAARKVHLLLAGLGYAVKGMIWLGRRVLWALMWIGQVMSNVLLREMEFDADRHALRLVGEEAFGSALREVAVISVANDGAMHDLGGAWRGRRLADDLPSLVRANIAQLEPEVQRKIVEHGLTENTTMYAACGP